MNVCGGHERSITMAACARRSGEHRAGAGARLPGVHLPEEDIYEAIQLALRERVILVAYGDMLRVP